MKIGRLLIRLALIGVGAGVGATGCAGQARNSAYVETGPPVVFNERPTLIETDSGVWVVRDYDYPVYYVDNAYWVYDDGVWYRAESYDRSWTRADVRIVPTVIVHRNHHAYVHYRGTTSARTRVAPRGPEMRPASLDRPRRHVSPPARRPPNQRVIEQRREANERAVEQRRLDAEQRRLDAERAAEQRRLDSERAAQQRRLDNEHAAAKRREANERAVEQRRQANERAAGQRRLENERAIEQRRLKEQRAAAEQRRRANERDRRNNDRREK